MLGNDVVDLRDSETLDGARHPRFDRRVFTRDELAALHTSSHERALRWSFWAAKEAAYKLVKKRETRAVFSPVRFAVHLLDEQSGDVCWNGSRFALQLCRHGATLHAIVCDAPHRTREILHGVEELASACDASTVARGLARELVAKRLAWPTSEISFARRGRAPVLLHRGEPSGVDLSLSHHGLLAAFACEVMPVAEAAGPLQ